VNSKINRRSLLVCSWLCSLAVTTSCSTEPEKPLTPSAADKQAAEAKLDRLLRDKQSQAEQREYEQHAAEQKEAERLAEAQKPHYPASELAAAARPRKWASIKVPDLNIQTVINTTWKDGKLNYRVAMLGQRPAIDSFTSQWHAFGIDFADQSGTNIFQFQIDPASFEWAPSSVNGGIPTKQMTGSIECELPRYEQSVQWNLTWAE
jgi:hypothetical protein